MHGCLKSVPTNNKYSAREAFLQPRPVEKSFAFCSVRSVLESAPETVGDVGVGEGRSSGVLFAPRFRIEIETTLKKVSIKFQNGLDFPILPHYIFSGFAEHGPAVPQTRTKPQARMRPPKSESFSFLLRSIFSKQKGTHMNRSPPGLSNICSHKRPHFYLATVLHQSKKNERKMQNPS